MTKINDSINDSDNTTLLVEWSLPWGNGEITGFTSALARPYRKILMIDKDPGKINFVFHKDEQISYVLGAFVYTNKHIIFYPGFLDRTLVSYKTQLLNKTKFHLDHFTLDNNLETWHIKFDENIKMPQLRTKKIDEKNYFWMILRIRSLESLEPTPKKLCMLIQTTSKKVKSKGKMLMKARDNAIFQETSLDEKINEEYFWQFEIFVNTEQVESNPSIPINALSNTNAIIRDTRTQNHMRVHQFVLQGFNGSIIIRVSKIIGTLTDPIQFIAGHDT